MGAVIEAWSNEAGAARARGLFADVWGGEPDGVWASPGRVNLIGEHVDYNGGVCMPIALPHRTFAAMRRRSDDVVRLVTDVAGSSPWEGRLGDLVPGGSLGWAAYAAGPAWALAQSGRPVSGFDAAICSCVPLGAGLSSSAAIECAVGLGLDELHGYGLAGTDDGRRTLAELCVKAENEVAGAPTGGLDQAASLRAIAGHALELDCLDRSIRQVRIDLASAGLVLLVVDTRAPHALADGQYASRRSACERAAAELGVSTLREVPRDAPLDAVTSPTDRKRVRHVVSEIARVADFAAAVEAGNSATAGELMYASHKSLRDDYEVSCRELDLVVEVARANGALGARMTGGGFGGSAIVLAKTSEANNIGEAILAAFAAQGLTTPGILFATAASGGARIA